jgi:hypothetical protein
MQLTAVHDLLTRPGPFVTVHTEVGRPTEDAHQQLDARWTTIRHALEHEQVPTTVIDALGEAGRVATGGRSGQEDARRRG